MRRARHIVALGLLLAMVSCGERAVSPIGIHREVVRRQPQPAAVRGLRTVLIAVDGLAAQWVNRYLKEGRFLAEQAPAPEAQWRSGGLARLARGARASSLRPVEPSMTAPNMLSMVTGVTPAEHGVLSNRFYRAGKRVSGFRQRPATQTLWQAATRQGKRALTWITLGARCDEPAGPLRRSACFASRGVYSSARAPVNVLLGSAAAAKGGQGGAKLVLRAGDRTRGRRQLTVALGRNPKGGVALSLPPGAALRGGARAMSVGDSREVLWAGATDGGALRSSWITLLRFDESSGKAAFHLAGTAVNVARPAAFRQGLDRARIVRPPPADSRSFQLGLIDEQQFVRTALREVDVAVALARTLGPGDSFDLATLYLAAVDAMAHQLLAPARRPELAPEEVRRFRGALEQGLRAFDRRLGLLLKALDLSRTRVILASDHGFLPLRLDVSLRGVLAGVDRRIRVVTAGGSGFVHLPRGLDSERVRRHLIALKVGGEAVFDARGILRSEDLPSIGLPARAADLFVRARPGFALSDRRARRVSVWPGQMATHGFDAELPAMAGVFLAAGPGVRRGPLGVVRQTQVTAAVAAALGIRPPPRARPGPPALWRPLSGQRAGVGSGGASRGDHALDASEITVGPGGRLEVRVGH